MSSLKYRISAPLEAGTSILDAQHLPSHVDAALQYASKRLARKGLHVTLVVVRREEGEPPAPRPTLHSRSASVATTRSGESDDNDGVIPIMLAPPATATTAASAAAAAAAAAASAATTTVGAPRRPSLVSTALGRLGRSHTQPNIVSGEKPEAAKGLKRSASSESASLRMAAARSQKAPQSPPTTASISAASTDVSGTTQTAPNPFGIHLVHTEELDARAERVLRHTIDKAERKFAIGTDWLPQASSAADRGLADLLVSRSVVQNEVLFSADGLTLLSLDHLYTFKRALAAYTRSGCQSRLEDAVDELRRCVLANGRRKLQRSQLMRIYPGLHFAEHALLDVAKMYRRAYGGPVGDTGIECDPLSCSPVRITDYIAATSSSSPLSSSSSSSSSSGSVLGDIPELPPLRLGDSAANIISQAAASAGISETDKDLAAVSRSGEFVRSERRSTISSTTSASSASNYSVSMPPTPSSPPYKAQPPLKLQTPAEQDWESQIGVAITTGEWDTPDSALTGVVDLDDYFGAAVGDGSLTARPASYRVPRAAVAKRSSAAAPRAMEHVDKVMLSPFGVQAARMSSQFRAAAAAATPRDYDDVSPITRGEWEFLMGAGDKWKAKTVAIETC